MKDKPLAYYIFFCVAWPLLAYLNFELYVREGKKLALGGAVLFFIAALYMLVHFLKAIRRKD